MKHRQTNGFINFTQRISTPTLGRSTRLLPRDLFDGRPEILDLYDRLTALREAEANHQRTASIERDAATTATAQYQADVREALATGKDATKVKNDTDRHTAQAEAHLQFARDAAAEADRISYRLAPLIADTAATLTGPSELVMEQAAKRVNGAIENLRKEWAAWSDAWKVRTILSQADLFGGPIVTYQPTGKLPTDVAAALDTLSDKVRDLDRLKEDEAKYREWRAEEEAAQAYNARALR